MGSRENSGCPEESRKWWEEVRVIKLSPSEWEKMSEDAHLVVFDELRPTRMDRIDFALLALDRDDNICAYVTCRELDEESVYWQYGGSFPGSRDTIKSFQAYQAFVRFSKENYKHVGTLIENTNQVMLKMAMKVGFIITGIRNFKGSILLEHQLDFRG